MQTPIFQISLAFFLGIIAVYYGIPVIVRISKTKHLVDEPNSRRVNTIPIPNLGGIALFLGISIGTLVAIQKNSFPDFRYLLICSIILLFMGVKDDLLMISARKKLAAQLVCAFVLVVLGNIHFTNLHGILGIHELNETTGWIISTLAIVSIINAINLIDGIDGLATSICMLTAIVLGVNFYLLNEVNFTILCSAIAGSLLTFFVFNVYGKSNKIFMGDTGAMILGLLISALIIKFNELAVEPQNIRLSHLSPVLSFALIAIPLIDMIHLFFIRLLRKKSPFLPDMNHIHHKFLDLGFTHKMTTGIIFAFNLFLISIVYSFKELNLNWLTLLIILLVTMFNYLPHMLVLFIKSTNSKERSIGTKNY